jgi:hypothetical protein
VLNDPDSVFALYQDGAYIESETADRVCSALLKHYSNNWSNTGQIVVE